MIKLKVSNGYLNKNIIIYNKSNHIKPTKSIIRTILFKYLNKDIINSYCLDLFCGTGILGIESISLHALKVDFNDINLRTLIQLNKNLDRLNISNNKYTINCNDYINYINNNKSIYDIIFIDPPFNLVINYIQLINKLLFMVKKGGYIYIEYSLHITNIYKYINNYNIVKFGIKGNISFILIKN